MRRALQSLEAQRLAGLFVAGWLLLDFPMLRLWEGGTVFGLPRLPVVLFIVWGLLIAALAWWMERGADRDGTPPRPDDVRGEAARPPPAA